MGVVNDSFNDKANQREDNNFPYLYKLVGCRARNNGLSTDNVWTDWGVYLSTVRLAGHVDRSLLIILKM